MLSDTLFPIIRDPIRISEKLSTLLDNIVVNSIHYDKQPSILYTDISDHLPVVIHMKTNIM